ncbi:MAG: iron-sulfur cluster-binding protein [Bacteroidetes bacterium]|nr:MAG: iron-sulfur cluster-binding protein [Bacteroidota bacterium]REK04664.1 MAG: iron-sulfur cluster-binding protein [Bacteroidota bacterium]REK51490.1 MAG: iron-sulfur cluster-binding protein [Bacteroidota bacterium]
MSIQSEQFLTDAESRVFDSEHRRKLAFNIAQYDKKVVDGKNQFVDFELARQRASVIKWKVLENLDKYLIEFESNLSKRGGKVMWAQNAAEAIDEIIRIMKSAEAKTVVKSKSMTTEELHVNDALEKEGIESIETDLGEFIVQLRKEHPYHIVTPAMHLSKEDVAKTFHEKYNLPLNSTPKEITAFVRQRLREKYQRADVGITGANFLIADTGSAAVTENEGNALMSVAFPRIHIVIAGIEKIIPSLTDLDLFWPLLATHGTGQNITVYNSILSGPKQSGEKDGPEEMYVILLDNGRVNLLSEQDQRQALSCIRCGACLNGCPVYKGVGGHAYGATYSGPIGSVITPHYNGMKEFKHLSYASSLCGKCTEVCPVKIDLHKLLLYNRRDSVEQKTSGISEKWMFMIWKKAMLSRSLMNKGGAGLKNFLLKNFFKTAWGDRREMPEIAPKSFNQLWAERNKSEK